MPHATINDGQVSDMVKNFPALTVRTAQRAMKRAGLDSTDPNLALQIVGTDEFKKAAADTIDARGDENAIRGQLAREPNLPDLGDPLGKRQIDLFTEREAQAQGQRRTESILATRIFEATQKASQLADFNEVAFKTKRIKELDPTSDLDDQIMKIRFRQMREEADIRSNPRFNHLSPAAKQRLIDTNRSEARETAGLLRETRDARLASAESRIDDEISSRNEIISRSKSRITDLKAAEEALKKTGESSEALFDIREKRQKAERDLAKTKGKDGDSEVEIITEAILRPLILEGFPATLAKKEAEILAKRIISENQRRKTQAGPRIQGATLREATEAIRQQFGGDNPRIENPRNR